MIPLLRETLESISPLGSPFAKAPLDIGLQLRFIRKRDSSLVGFLGRGGGGGAEHVRGKDKDVEGAWAMDQLVKTDDVAAFLAAG